MTKEQVLRIVDNCFHKYASSYRQDAAEEAERQIDAIESSTAVGNEVLADVNGSSIADVKLVDYLFAEYNKAYSNTKAGQIYPQWFTSEQLKWIETVFKNCR
jgi:hypothetical protein